MKVRALGMEVVETVEDGNRHTFRFDSGKLEWLYNPNVPRNLCNRPSADKPFACIGPAVKTVQEAVLVAHAYEMGLRSIYRDPTR